MIVVLVLTTIAEIQVITHTYKAYTRQGGLDSGYKGEMFNNATHANNTNININKYSVSVRLTGYNINNCSFLQFRSSETFSFTSLKIVLNFNKG